jgi:hypothetical protein
MEEFTPTDPNAVHRAMLNAKEAGKSRRAKNSSSSSAEAFEHQAHELEVTLNKILDRLPERSHEQRALVYRDYDG